MTPEERKIRMDVAVETLEKVYSNMCNSWEEDISREQIEEFCYLINDLRRFAHNLCKDGNNSLEDKINSAKANAEALAAASRQPVAQHVDVEKE